MASERSKNKPGGKGLQSLSNETSYWASLVENSPDAILSRDANKIIISWNKGAEVLLGYTKEEAIGKNAFDLGMIRFTDDETKDLEQALDKTGVWKSEKEYYHKNGTRLFGSVTANSIKDDSGATTSVTFIIRDITEQKVLKEKLNRYNEELEERVKEKTEEIKLREAQLELYIQHSPAAIAMFDTEMKYLVTSQRWLDDYGLHGKDIIGKSHYEIFPEITDEWKDIHQRCLNGAVEKKEEDPFLRADGSTNWLRWEVRPWFTPSGSIGGIIIFTEDITARKQSEAALAKTEEKYREVLDRVADGFMGLDADWHFTYINNWAASVMGRFAEDLVGKNIWNEFPNSVNNRFYTAYHEAMRTQQNIQVEDYSDTVRAWTRVNIYPSPSGLSIYFRDISKQKEAEEKALKKEKEAIRSHDIQQIIMSSALDAIICTNETGVITQWNAQAEQLFGWTEKEVLKKNLTDTIIPRRHQRRHNNGMKKYSQTGIGPMLKKLVETDAVNAAGKEFPIELFIVPVEEKGKGSHVFCAFIRDISARKKAERDILKSQLRLQQAQEIAHLGNWELDLETNISNWSDEAYRIYGLEPGNHKISQEEWLEFIHPEDRNFVTEQIKISGSSLEETGFYHRIIRKDGMVRYLYSESHYEFNTDGKPVRLYGIVHDITEIKMLEIELQEQKLKEQLNLTAAALLAQEKERNLIGAELHDNVNQILVGTKLRLSIALQNPSITEDIVNSSINLLQEAINENRKIAHELVAPDFRHESLIDQLKNVTNTMLHSAGIDVTIESASLKEALLSKEQKLTLYRVTQEQCTNIVKYAEARTVQISLSCSEHVLKMIIADDGKGGEEEVQSKGIGLRNIKSRLSILDGTVNVRTATGKGFALEIIMPVTKTGKKDHS